MDITNTATALMTASAEISILASALVAESFGALSRREAIAAARRILSGGGR